MMVFIAYRHFIYIWISNVRYGTISVRDARDRVGVIVTVVLCNFFLVVF